MTRDVPRLPDTRSRRDPPPAASQDTCQQTLPSRVRKTGPPVTAPDEAPRQVSTFTERPQVTVLTPLSTVQAQGERPDLETGRLEASLLCSPRDR